MMQIGKHRRMDVQALWNAAPARYPELTGRTAVVTGSSRGIGLGIAVRLAREGMRVVVNGRTAETVQEVSTALTACGAEVLAVTADLETPAGVDTLFDQTLTTYGGVDVLVNNAADVKRYHFFEVDDTLLDHFLQANIGGPYRCAMRAARWMRDTGRGGSIINISSIGGLQAHWTGLPYDVTKGALNMMTMAMALELAQYSIRVNAIAPGAIRTYEVPQEYRTDWEQFQARIPLGRAGHPMEIGAAAAYLSSNDAAYITGTILPVDGGVMAQIYPKQSPI
ncbi:MAG: SDR family oxidoreductase [Anaerolineae bacterium]|nr:SDR family oxidoreductase [Anaerolineae bacterium]